MKTKIQIFQSLCVGVVFLILAYSSTEDNDTPETKSTSKINCDYNKVEIKAYQVGTDKLLDEKLIDGCFERKVVDETLGLVEITNDNKTIKVSYYKESDPNILRFLDIKIGEGEPSRWRANQGHDLFITEKEGNLSFVFGDRKKSKIKGTIKFMK